MGSPPPPPPPGARARVSAAPSCPQLCAPRVWQLPRCATRGLVVAYDGHLPIVPPQQGVGLRGHISRRELRARSHAGTVP
eukprot:3377788-Prymnesium_polylepis.1